MRILLVVLLIACLPSLAGAAWTLTYIGETNDITSYGAGAADKWDYVYKVNLSTPGGPGGIRWWTIGAIEQPTSIIVPPSTDWHWAWGVIGNYAEPDGMPTVGDALYGQYGITFYTSEPHNLDDYIFRFQSNAAPMLVNYDGSTGSGWTGADTTWSNPEPVSCVLAGLALAGGLWTRRRKTALAGKARQTQTPVD